MTLASAHVFSPMEKRNSPEYTTSTNRGLVLGQRPGYELGVERSIGVFVFMQDLYVGTWDKVLRRIFTKFSS